MSRQVVYDRDRLLQRAGLLYGEVIPCSTLPSTNRCSPIDRPTNPQMGGEMPWEYGEGNYAVRVGLPARLGGAGLCTARLHLEDACTLADLASLMDDEPATPPHGSRLCHTIFDEARPKTERDLSDYNWFLWGTLLHPKNVSRLESNGVAGQRPDL